MPGYAQQAPTDVRLLEDLEQMKFVPGWHRPGNPPLWAAPTTPYAPAAWRYEQAREALIRASRTVDMEFAERRNLILTNPAEGIRYPTVRTIVLAYQMLLPGEHARTHRHSPHAGRLVLDADDGAYTVVEGVRLPLAPGDVLLTPGWQWHGHGHDGKQPAIWLDFLDAPLVQLLDPMFFEPYSQTEQDVLSTTADSPLLFTWADTNARLDAAQPSASGHFGKRVELGAPALPTIGLHMHRLAPGQQTRQVRTTANYQFCVVEGSGRSVVGGTEISWRRGDVFVAPCWSGFEHLSAAGATLFEITDEPLQRHCGYLRTQADIARGDGRHRELDQHGAPAADGG